jgi:hypothetical protein
MKWAFADDRLVDTEMPRHSLGLKGDCKGVVAPPGNELGRRDLRLLQQRDRVLLRQFKLRQDLARLRVG